MKPFYIRQSAIRALERATNAESWEMLGALGVAADPYPHQIANVRRILEASEIRHLIADEVGMGKTVQAFMILNVLRRREPSLRVAIVAPERICYQWQAELSARAHIAASIWNEDSPMDRPAGEGYVHIIRAEVTRAEPALPSPQVYDMLIVDEPHVLNLRQMSFLSTLCRAGLEGSRFRHVLLLTATPRLRNREWARSLFNIIEPERTEAANLLGKEPLDYMLEAVGENTPDLDAGIVDEAQSPYRRILRQTRQGWPGVAPCRRLQTCFAQPNQAELARISLASARLRGIGPFDGARLDGAPWQQIRQLFWSRETVRDALRHRTFAKLSEPVNHCMTVLGRSPGDALFEELCDVLLRIWDKHRDRRVIIVAGDTPTVDMIEQRLLRLFPDFAEENLIATMRGRHNTDLVDVVGAVHGGARVLIMEEWVEAGLNLHHFADDIVFYGVPWSVSRIDQLIGRLDRLRPGGLRNAIEGKPVGEIVIWRLVICGSPDERVLEALDRMRVFESPLPFLDDELASRMETTIAMAASAAPGFLELAEKLSQEIHLGDAELKSVADHGAKTKNADIGLTSKIRVAEQLAENWLRSLDGCGAFKVGWPKSVDGERIRMISLPRVRSDCPYSIGAMTTREGEVLRVSRSRLGHSPSKDVLLSGDGVGRRARFFSTGDDLHDDLVRQAIALGAAQDAFPGARPLPIRFPIEHEVNILVGSTLAISAFGWRPSVSLSSAKSLIQSYGDWQCEGVQGLRLLHEGLVVGLDADQRWLALRFPSIFRLVGTRIDDNGNNQELPQEACEAVLSKDARFRDNRALQAGIPLCKDAAKVFREHETAVRSEAATRIVRMREAAKTDMMQRTGHLMQEASYYIRTRSLNIERLEGHNIIDPRQRQMQEGQIMTERRRMEARQQGAMIRARALEELVERLGNSFEPVVLRILVRVTPAIGHQ